MRARPRALRLRPTFLLRLVSLALALLAFAGLLSLNVSFGMRAGGLLTLIVLWFLGIEGGLLPLLIERLLLRTATSAAEPPGDRDRVGESIWFVDLDRVAERQASRHTAATRDNPTLR